VTVIRSKFKQPIEVCERCEKLESLHSRLRVLVDYLYDQLRQEEAIQVMEDFFYCRNLDELEYLVNTAEKFYMQKEPKGKTLIEVFKDGLEKKDNENE